MTIKVIAASMEFSAKTRSLEAIGPKFLLERNGRASQVDKTKEVAMSHLSIPNPIQNLESDKRYVSLRLVDPKECGTVAELLETLEHMLHPCGNHKVRGCAGTCHREAPTHEVAR